MGQLIGGIVVILLIASLVTMAAMFIVPAAIFGVGLYFFIKWFIKYQKEADKRRLLQQRTANLQHALQVARVPDARAFMEELWPTIQSQRNGKPLLEYIEVDLKLGPIMEIFKDDDYDLTVPPPPLANLESIEHAKYRDYMSERLARRSAEGLQAAKRILATTIQGFCDCLPDIAFKPYPMQWEEEQAFRKSALFSVPLVDSIDVPKTISKMIDQLNGNGDAHRYYLWEHLRGQLHDNLVAASENPDRLVPPSKHPGTPREIWDAYLKETPLHQLGNLKLPFSIPELARFEHHWIISPPGTGKSTTLTALINRDLDRVARGEASVIVMESKRDLIKGIEGLARFAPGGDLHGRLVVLDPEDVEWPIALNLFDIGLSEINQASPRDKEAMLNSAVAMLDYVFRALLGAELTSRQSTLFNFTIQLLINIPGATLDTFIDLMQPKAAQKYQRYIDKLDRDARSFFQLKFDSQELKRTKDEVTDRLFAVKRIRSLSRMFSAPNTKLNLYEEIGKGKVILINAAKSLLQEDGVEVFGRFFLAMILLAAEKRQLLSHTDRLPAYLYLDECQDIIRRDQKIPTLLDQARAFRVGLVLAHQRLDQLDPSVLNALFGSTTIKFAAQVSDANASALARNMGTTPDFILKQPHYSYAAHIRTLTAAAVSLKIPYINFMDMPRMSDLDAVDIREQMRAKYAIHVSQLDDVENLPAVRGEPEIIPPEAPAPSWDTPPSHPAYQPPPQWNIPPGTEVTHRTRKTTTTTEETETTIRKNHKLSDW